LTPRQHY